MFVVLYTSIKIAIINMAYTFYFELTKNPYDIIHIYIVMWYIFLCFTFCFKDCILIYLGKFPSLMVCLYRFINSSNFNIISIHCSSLHTILFTIRPLLFINSNCSLKESAGLNLNVIIYHPYI